MIQLQSNKMAKHSGVEMQWEGDNLPKFLNLKKETLSHILMSLIFDVKPRNIMKRCIIISENPPIS